MSSCNITFFDERAARWQNGPGFHNYSANGFHMYLLCFAICFSNYRCVGFFLVETFLLGFVFWTGWQDYYSWCFPAAHLSQLFFLLSLGLFRVLNSSILGKVLQIVIGQYSQWQGESVQLFISLWSCQLERKKAKRLSEAVIFFFLFL